MRKIRRKEKAIQNIEEIKLILLKVKYVTLALCKNNRPYLVTLSHGFNPKKNVIYFHCASEGKKIDYISENSKIWGQALLDFGYSKGKCDHKYATAQFSGNVNFVKNFDEKKSALKLMIRQLEENPEQVLKKQLSSSAIQKVKIGKITIAKMSGKKHRIVQIT